MEKIEMGDLITLENEKEFICLSVIEEEDGRYLFLMSNFKPLEIKFAKENITENSVELNIIGDQQKKLELLAKFREKMGNINF